LFEEACRIAVEYGRFHMAWLGFVDAEALKIKPAAWAGDTEGFFDVARMLLNKAGKDRRGLIWDAYCEKRPVTSNDVQNDPRVLLAEYYKKRGIHSVGIFPLMLDNEVSGMLGFYSKEPDIFDEEEIKLLTELANDISFGLQYITKDEKLNYLAYYDSLTGLPNRTLFLDRLTQALHAAKQTQTKVAVLVGDVQHFRQINETFGRQAGDMLLRELAERIRSLAPDPDNVARIGADVFAAIISDVKTPTDVARLFEDVFTKIYNMKFILTGKELSIKMVAGAAIFPNDGEDADVLCRNAEAAQKKAKLTGDRYLFYQPEMTARIAETLLLENKLRKAIELDQFVLHYQPKVHVETHKVTGLEALIRWNDPESGLVPPMKFIPILEESGMILEVGFWVIRRAFADARRWRAEGIQPPRIAVNVSQVQMQQKDFVADVRRAIAEYGSEPLMLDLEITETMLMRDIDENIEKLSTVRKMGIVIAIDDFGTGYSSLGYLARLPVNALKIDRSFIARMTSSPESMTIVSTIISLAHSMNLKVIAEGVETDEQSKFLRLLKCDELQGYLFSKPLPPDKVVDLLRVG
jgi:diguanylate cyclase (GGDEF)-like protein